MSPATDAAHAWPVAGLAVAGVLTAAGWLLFRERLLPRRTVGLEQQLAGYSVGLLGLGVVALTVAAVNPYALIFVLPSLYVVVAAAAGHESSVVACDALRGRLVQGRCSA